MGLATNGGSRKWIITSLIVLLAGACIYGGFQWWAGWKKDHVYVSLEPIHTEIGWGYDIWVDKSRFMHQTYIPAITGHYGFRTKEDAMAVGKIIYDQVMAGQLPTISAEQIRAMGIFPDTTMGGNKEVIVTGKDSIGGAKDSLLHK